MTSLAYKNRSVILAIMISSFVLFTTHGAYAVPAISFDSLDYARDFPGPGTGAAIITVTDSAANTNPGSIDTASVTVTSQADPSGIQLSLKETGVNTGVFQGTVEFMTGNYLFPESHTVTITQQDTSANTNTTRVDTISENIRSDHSGANPITETFSETGVNTGTFQGKLNFGGFSSSTQGIIFAQGGDYVQISIPGGATWSLITPNSNVSKGALLVNSNTDDVITATYGAIFTQATEGLRYAPGGGGGGIVSPGLVLDAAASIGGSSPPPPTFSLGVFAQANLLPPDLEKKLLNHDPFDPIGPSSYASVPYYPLSIDGNGYLIGGYANTLETVTEQVGKPANLTFTTISRPLVHMSIYTNMHNISDEIADSDTFVTYDKGQPLQIVDPHGFFSKVTVDTKQDGNKQSISYNVIFAKSMPKSNIIMRAWDDHHASQDIKFFDAWQAVESGGTQTSSSNVPQAGLIQNIEPQPSQVQAIQTNPELVDIIKQWGGYSPKSISDSEMLSDMGIDAKHIPSWYMKTSKWVVSNDMTPEEFVNAIKYMYDKGIIH